MGSACFSSSILLSASPSAPHRLCPPLSLSLSPPSLLSSMACFLLFLHLITFPHGICPSVTLRVGISTGCVGNTCWCIQVIATLFLNYSFRRQGRWEAGGGGRKIFIACFLFVLASASIICMSSKPLWFSRHSDVSAALVTIQMSAREKRWNLDTIWLITFQQFMLCLGRNSEV